jgi:hypothetical protein
MNARHRPWIGIASVVARGDVAHCAQLDAGLLMNPGFHRDH